MLACHVVFSVRVCSYNSDANFTVVVQGVPAGIKTIQVSAP